MPKSKEYVTSESDSGSDVPASKRKAKDNKSDSDSDVEPASKRKAKDDKSDSDSDVEPSPKKKTKPEKKPEKKGKKSKSSSDDEVKIPLSRMRFASVQEFHGKKLISIREFYEKDGEMLPGRKGISLTPDQWEKLKDGIPEIDDAL